MDVDDYSSKIIRFTNCSILRNHRIYKDDLWISNGKILNPEHVFYNEKLVPDHTVFLNDDIIAPGFIDIQINGGFGVDFTHDLMSRPYGLGIVAKGILAHGVTAFCPTVVTSKPEVYHNILPMLAKNIGGKDGAEILGAHVEGPFINPLKKGAHSLDDILEFEEGLETVKDVYKHLNNVKIMTLAPEKENSFNVIEYLTQTRNIKISIGHSLCDLPTAVKAVNCGASLITHLFNAMPPFHHRDPGLVGLLGLDHPNPVFYGIIADGIHTHEAALKIAYNTHPKGLILVTDAISAMGLSEGTHHIGKKKIEILGKSAFIAGTKTLCGSIATMNESVKYFKQTVGCSSAEALEAASLHAAQALGLAPNKGTLNYGSDADFVVLDKDLNVLSTWIAGTLVCQNLNDSS